MSPFWTTRKGEDDNGWHPWGTPQEAAGKEKKWYKIISPCFFGASAPKLPFASSNELGQGGEEARLVEEQYFEGQFQNTANLAVSITLEQLIQKYSESEGIASPKLEKELGQALQDVRKEMPIEYVAGESFIEHNMKLFAALYSRSGIVPFAGKIWGYEVVKKVGPSDSGVFGECFEGRLWGACPVALKRLRTKAEKPDSEKNCL
ncbi:hypothetical protein BOTBODRAFT_42233 [Botryobasidium botryosum FD-172 SS1]|uniref:Uncharacterized protein n=1 Tax=Botryobasidium botryosum (strain FD-172 SS1) TaxID=930990 RepID=A0A067N360_BOTB1|nr:hypothetical protein BOTBODRAFT_42233 [Botryobasidium botryosum FD-172 SS1]